MQPRSDAPLSRRAALRLMAAAAGLTLLAACGPAGAAATPPGASTSLAATPTLGPVAPNATPAGAQPRSGGTLTLATASETDTLDGHRLYQPTQVGVFQMYDTLTAFDDQRQPQPVLAESWDVASDFKRVRLNLRKGVQFHDGREFTSDDVKFNILRVRDPKLPAAQLLFMSNWFTEVQTPDKYTVVLASDEPRPAMFDFFEFLNIVDQNTVASGDKTRAVGTGPFALGEWVQGDHLNFTRNRNYWRSGKPLLDGISISIVPDAQTLLTSLEAASVLAAAGIPLTSVPRLKSDPKYAVVLSNNVGGFLGLGVNTTVPPTDNKLVRQGLNYAINRQRFADTALAGIGQPIDLPWPPGSPAFDVQKNARYAFDLDKARAAFNESGVSDIQLDYVYPPQTYGLAEMGQIIQNDLASVGVKLNLKALELSVFNSTIFARNYSGVFGAGGGFVQVEPSTLFFISAFYKVGANNPGFNSDRYAQLANASATETDSAKRKQLYDQMNDVLLDECFTIPVASSPGNVVSRSTVNGLAWRLNGSLQYSDVWLAA
ncbi:MAG TPA: ABC transporter substrate-binding protein [Chloroflexota bacterium]